MSTYSPAVSNMPSISRIPRPLSITWVSPLSRGFEGRAGRSRKFGCGSPLETGKELLQLVLRLRLHVVVERVAVRVDPDRERPEVPDPETPEALGHQLLPGHLLDLLDLRRLERSSAADDREIDHPEPLHRLDRLVGEPALPADRANAVLPAERLGEAHHARGGGRADADLLVAAALELAHARRRVQQERAVQVHRRLDALVEDSDLRTVADPDDVALDGHLVARAELEDLRGVGDRERDLVARHLRIPGHSRGCPARPRGPRLGAQPSTGS